MNTRREQTSIQEMCPGSVVSPDVADDDGITSTDRQRHASTAKTTNRIFDDLLTICTHL